MSYDDYEDEYDTSKFDHRESRAAPNPKAAVKAYQDRSIRALIEKPEFFTNPDHVAKVNIIKDMVDDFLPVNQAVYVERVLTGKGANKKAHTSIKVRNPTFPNSLSQSEKKRRFYDVLVAAGVGKPELRYDSYIFRIF